VFRKRWPVIPEDPQRVLGGLERLQGLAHEHGIALEQTGIRSTGASVQALYVNQGAWVPQDALCVQADLSPPWGDGGWLMAWSRDRDEVVQVEAWLRGLELIHDQVAPPPEPLTAVELYNYSTRLLGRAYHAGAQEVLATALASSAPELREAAARLVGTLHWTWMLPEAFAARDREERPDLRALFDELIDCLLGEPPGIRWLEGEFAAVCEEVKAAMPERVALTVVEPLAFAWGGEADYRFFELRGFVGVPGVALQVYPGREDVASRLPVGVPLEALGVAAWLICDPRYSPEAYAALDEALGGDDPGTLLVVIQEVLDRTQVWPLRLLAKHLDRLPDPVRAEGGRLLALPQFIEPDVALTAPMLQAGRGALLTMPPALRTRLLTRVCKQLKADDAAWLRAAAQDAQAARAALLELDRRVGREPLITAAHLRKRTTVETPHGPLHVGEWRLDETARAALWSRIAMDSGSPEQTLAEAYASGDAETQIATLHALALTLDREPERGAALIREACGSEDPRLIAAACCSPYAGRHLNDADYRQALLQAFSAGVDTDSFPRLVERADGQLTRSLLDRVDELQAAGKNVPTTIWPIAALQPPPGLVERLVSNLEHPDPLERRAAAWGLLNAREPRTLPALTKRLEQETDASVRAALTQARNATMSHPR
jgi:hypothetical protein